MLILEGDSSLRGKIDYLISFTYKGTEVKFQSISMKDISGEVFDWLYNNGYKFDGKSNNSKNRKLLNEVELENLIKTTTYGRRSFHNVAGKKLYLINSYNSHILIEFIINMLVDFGIDKNQIRTDGFYVFKTPKTKIKKFGDKYFTGSEEIDVEKEIENEEPIDKMTFSKAAQVILQENDNDPMTGEEIWDEIVSRDLVDTTGKTPKSSLISIMRIHSVNGNTKRKLTEIFQIVSLRPSKFILINPDEIQDVPDVEEYEIEMDDEILTPSDFIKTSQKPKVYVKSPFRQSICILGPSGKGKSYTTELMLDQLENTKDSEFEFIIPTASTTGLLSQYSPKGEYIKSRLGRMIMSSHNNPERLFTAVFDECHKSAVIEMINDELLQCISTRRNDGKRFISVDEETGDLYTGLSTHRGNLLIPDNFGFIFLSSKPDVIISNSDFFNRVDIYVLTEQPPKDADLSLDYDEKGNVILPSYFTKIEGKGKDTEDDINNLLQ